MSWLFSQALAEEYSEDICLDGVQFVLLNVMPTAHQFLHRDKTTAFANHSQYGVTFALLTVKLGEELLMSFLEDSRVKTSALPEEDGVLGARHVGANHKRDRIWIFANSRRKRRNERPSQTIQSKSQESVRQNFDDLRRELSNSNKFHAQGERSNTYTERREKTKRQIGLCDREKPRWINDWRKTEPDVGRVANGVPYRVERLKALGNAQVPRVASFAWETLQ